MVGKEASRPACGCARGQREHPAVLHQQRCIAPGISGFPMEKALQEAAHSSVAVAEELSISSETLWLGGLSPPPVHLRHSGGRKENPSENHNLITPICSGAASHFCLPGCLSPMLSSTLFSISCNHLLEISFSFKMSPWKGNSASWDWAGTTRRKPTQEQPSSGGSPALLLYSLKPHSRFLFRVGSFEHAASGTSPWLVVSASGAVEELPAPGVGGDLIQPVTGNFVGLCF